MSDAIDRAAKVIGDILQADPQIAHEMRGDEPDQIASALAEAGLLAPAPLREVSKYVRTADEFCKGEQGTKTHRCWVTDWFPVDAVNRAEGDGRAEG